MPLKRVAALFLVGLIVAVALPLASDRGLAYSNPGAPQGLVSDFANLLTPDERQALEQTLAAYQQSSGNEVAVVTINSLGGDTVENYANELFKDWGIGKKGKDNGVLLLVAKDDRELRIEVGYGLEGDLTDAQSSAIINQIITPEFKKGDYGAGLTAGAAAILETLGGQSPVGDGEANSQSFDWAPVIWVGLFGLMWLSSILARSKSWWAGGLIGGLAGGGLWLGQILAWVWILPLIGLGLAFDWFVSRAYQKSKTAGVNPPWWIGGPGRGGFGGGGSHFGGFGGGISGGGGASGRW